jgi:hypothetical protein
MLKMRLSSRGIVVLAVGRPVFGRLAAMLAATIRVHSPEVPIALLYQPSALTELDSAHLDLFDYHILVPDSAIFEKKQYQLCKLHAWELSPFQQTLFVDADTVWLPFTAPAEALDFAANNYACYQFQTYGFCAPPDYAKSTTNIYTYWEPPSGLALYLDFKGKFYCASSTIFWFDRSVKSKKLFEFCRRVKELFISGRMKIRPQNHNGQYPDELIFNCAMALNGHDQAFEEDYKPVYFQHVERKAVIKPWLTNFWALTTSNMPPNEAVNIYNSETLAACKALNIRHLHLQTK